MRLNCTYFSPDSFTTLSSQRASQQTFAICTESTCLFDLRSGEWNLNILTGSKKKRLNNMTSSDKEHIWKIQLLNNYLSDVPSIKLVAGGFLSSFFLIYIFVCIPGPARCLLWLVSVRVGLKSKGEEENKWGVDTSVFLPKEIKT